ncbi:MAG: TolC family protein [Daejeonella sp.]
MVILVLHLNSSNAQETIADFSSVYLEKLIATAKENYPRINSFKGQVNLAKNKIARESLSWFDAFSFSYVYNPANTLDILNPRFFNGYQAAVSFNLSAILQKPHNVKQAKEELKIAQYAQEEYNLSIESEVKKRYFSYLQQLNNLRLQTKMVSDIQGVNRDIKTRYERSEITFEQYNQAQIAYSGAIQTKISAEAGFFSSKAALEELLTKKLEEVQ